MYTWRLPPEVREARREEIASDLWESAHDPHVTQVELVIQMVTRLTFGIADDLAWRLARVRVTRSVMLRTVTAAAVMCMLLMFAVLAQLTTAMPHLPEGPIGAPHVHSMVPDPPPPPPAPGATTSQERIFNTVERPTRW